VHIFEAEVGEGKDYELYRDLKLLTLLKSAGGNF
jgi:hypothetical protein